MLRILRDAFSTPHTPRMCARAWLLSLGVLLSACGGGESPPPLASGLLPSQTPVTLQAEDDAEAHVDDPVEADSAAVAIDGPGLIAGPLDTVDTGPAGTRVVIAVGALARGGHAVIWAAPLPDAPAPAWTLWVQAFDRDGAKSGAAAMLDIGGDVLAPLSASAVVLPEGGVAVGWLAERNTPPGGPVARETTVYTAIFSLDGTLRHGPRQLDSLGFAPFFPRADRLGGPVVTALGPDGSYLVGWRYNPGSYFGRQPSFRIQRLAADSEPLGWIQHLARSDLFGSQLAFDRLRLTVLDEGGWVASFTELSPTLGLLGQVVQHDVPRPLHIPEVGSLAPGAWVLDLRRHGSVLFADRHGVTPETAAAPYSMHFDRQGREQDPVQPLPAIPTTAAALRGGDYVAMWRTEAGTAFNAQRYTPKGQPVGEPFTIDATDTAQVTGLRRGGMALAWVETTDSTSRVLTQRLQEPGAP